LTNSVWNGGCRLYGPLDAGSAPDGGGP